MKPEGWDQWPEARKLEYAKNFFTTVRGQFILGQALAVASRHMKTRPFPETSNIEDMEVLGEIFSLGFDLHTAQFEEAAELYYQHLHESQKHKGP